MVEWTEEELKRVAEITRKALKEKEYLYQDIPQTHIPTVKNIKNAVRYAEEEGK